MAAIPQRLDEQTRATGYLASYKPTSYKGLWPQPSKKPFHLYMRFDLPNGAAHYHHLASFATIEQLERNWRARAGC